MSYFLHFVKNSNLYFIIYLPVGKNAKPIDYTTSGIFMRTTSALVQTERVSGWLCYDYFTAYDAQVVCLIWGFLPWVIIMSAFQKIFLLVQKEIKNNLCWIQSVIALRLKQWNAQSYFRILLILYNILS